MTIAGFLILDSDGRHEIRADAFGSHLAFSCPKCQHPVLASALENERGSDEEHPAECPSCHRRYFLDIRPGSEKLYIHEG